MARIAQVVAPDIPYHITQGGNRRHGRGNEYGVPGIAGKVKERVREILHPGNQAPWPEVAQQINRVTGGWANYFGYGSRRLAYRAVEACVTERVRHFLWRRHKLIGQGSQRFSRRRIFGELGVRPLGAPSVTPPAWAPV